MKITEVRIFPTQSKDGKLKAFATMTFDDWFVVRNVKVIQGNNGLFVAMPSRKAMHSCVKCHFKNVRGSKYCNQCGAEIIQTSLPAETEGEKYGNHMDIAHPITQDCRVYIQEKILAAYNADRSRQQAEDVSYKPAEEEDLSKTEDTARSEKEEAAEVAVEEVEDTKDIEL